MLCCAVLCCMGVGQQDSFTRTQIGEGEHRTDGVGSQPPFLVVGRPCFSSPEFRPAVRLSVSQRK